MDILKLKEQRADLLKKARAVADKANGENREMNTEEKAEFDKIFVDADALQDRITSEVKLRRAERSLNKTDRVLKGAGPGKKPTTSEAEKAKAENELRVKAYRNYLIEGARGLSPQEKRALSAGDSTKGGYTIAPQVISQKFVDLVRDMNFVRSLATVETVVGAESLGVVSRDTLPDYADWTNELLTGLAEDDTMTFGKRELTPHQLVKLVKVSKKLLRRSTRSAEDLVIEPISYKVAATQENKFLNGTGTNQPLGMFVASDFGIPTSRDVVSGSATGITYDGMVNFRYYVKSAYLQRPNAGIICHRDLVKKALQLKTTSTDQPLFVASLTELAPDNLWGVPLYLSEYAPNTFTNGLYVAVIGDFAQYHIADAEELEIQRMVEYYATTGQIGFLATTHTDGMPVDANAFARLKCST